jgi:hypothetical protein
VARVEKAIAKAENARPTRSQGQKFERLSKDDMAACDCSISLPVLRDRASLEKRIPWHLTLALLK